MNHFSVILEALYFSNKKQVASNQSRLLLQASKRLILQSPIRQCVTAKYRYYNNLCYFLLSSPPRRQSSSWIVRLLLWDQVLIRIGGQQVKAISRPVARGSCFNRSSTARSYVSTSTTSTTRGRLDYSGNEYLLRKLNQQQQRKQPLKSISLYEMNAEKIRQITDIHQLEQLVNQLESMTTTTKQQQQHLLHHAVSSYDIGPLILPMIRMTSMEKFGIEGAILTERILFHCLSLLPPNISDRRQQWNSSRQQYHDSNNIVGHDTNLNDIALNNRTIQQQLLPYPTTSMYNRAIIAWGACGTIQAAERAQKIFDYMKSEYFLEVQYDNDQQQQQKDQRQQSHSRSSHPFDPQSHNPYPSPTKQQNHFRFDVVDDHNEDEEWNVGNGVTSFELRAPAPCRRTYKSLIRAWAATGTIRGVQRAYELLEELEQQSGIAVVTKNNKDMEKEEDHRRHQQQSMSSIVPTNTDFRFLQLEPPDRGTYNIVLSAYSKVNQKEIPDAFHQVKNLVQRLDQLYQQTQDEEYMLDWISFHSLLRAYSNYVAAYDSINKARKSMSVTTTKDIDHYHQMAYEIEQVLQRIGRQEALGYGPQITKHLSLSWAYGVWIDALIKTKEPKVESLERAHGILLGMTHKPGGIPLPISLNRRTVGRDQHKTQDHDQDNWPRQETMIRVIQAWDRSGIPDASDRIQDIVQMVVESPYSRVHYLDEAMEVWIQSGYIQFPHVVDSMLQHAITNPQVNLVKPTGKTFAIAIKSWLKCRTDLAPHRAELLLYQLAQLYHEQGGKWYEPREVHLRYVMTTWLMRCRSGRKYRGLAGILYPAQHAEGLMELFGNADWLYKENLSGLFAMAIQIWSLQKLEPQQEIELNPIKRALLLLNDFERQVGQGFGGFDNFNGTDRALPAFPCNYVLATCTRSQPTSDRSMDAYRIAEATFQRGKRNPRTFALMAQVVRMQYPQAAVPLCLPPLQVAMEQLFVECCTRGLLSQELADVLADVLPSESLQKLFGLSYSYAEALVHARNQWEQESQHLNEPLTSSAGENKSWSARCRPKALSIENLPMEWIQNAVKRKN